MNSKPLSLYSTFKPSLSGSNKRSTQINLKIDMDVLSKLPEVANLLADY